MRWSRTGRSWHRRHGGRGRLAALSQWEKNGEHKVGLKVMASRVMSIYDAGLRRKAASPKREPGGSRPPISSAVPERYRSAMRPAAAASPSSLVDWGDDEPV
jgi:hypothetical protein